MTSCCLSLVMPVYNVATYLPACLDSLMAQTLPPDEIIAVDDGSTDACPEILADYAKRMSNLRIVRQENGGLSAARNTGLDHANGKWLAFIDSDDFVTPDMYERLVAMAESDDLDMALCNAWFHHEGRHPDTMIYPDTQLTGIMSGHEWLRMRLTNDRLLHMVWMHLYRRDFIEHHGFRFVPRLIHEDVIWTTRALIKARRVRFDPTPYYRYRLPVRCFALEQKILRLEAIIASSVINAHTLVEMAHDVGNMELSELLTRQWVDGALSVFHKTRQLPKAARAARLAQLRKEGFFRLLWHNARGFAQHRRIARNWMRSFLS